MKIGPKYKIARRLGAPIFEKTQNQKYALRESNKRKSFRPRTDFGLQLNEKQKARMFYGVTEKQFAGYVNKALRDKKGNPSANLYSILESRMDNVVWRSGILPTHRNARQAVAHGHFLVNGRKTTIPSRHLEEGDIITIREGSKNKKLFGNLDEKTSETSRPAWMEFDQKKGELKIKSKPQTDTVDTLFDLGQVIEFYQR